MGASAGQIFLLLTNKILIMIIAAIVIAWPATWFGIEKWLNSFAYRIDLSAKYFIVGTLITLAIALISIGLEVTRAVAMRPVDILKEE